MMRAPIALPAGLGVALVSLTAAGTGRADPSVAGPSKAQCIAADTQAQSLRLAGKFTASRAALAIGAPSTSDAAADGEVWVVPLGTNGSTGTATPRSVKGVRSFGVSVAYSGSATNVADTLFVGAPDAGSAGAGAPGTLPAMSGQAFASSCAQIEAGEEPASMGGTGDSTSAFGTAVAISPDGTIAAVGDPQVDSGAGAVTLYMVVTKPNPSAILSEPLPVPAGAAPYGAALAIGTDWIAIGAPAEPGGGAVYLCPLPTGAAAGACRRGRPPLSAGDPGLPATIGTALAVTPGADVAALAVGQFASGGVLLVH